MDDDSVTLQEAADALGVHYMTAYRYVRAGRLPAHKTAGNWRVRTVDITAFGLATGSDAGARRVPAERRRANLLDRLVAGDEAGAWSVVEEAIQGAMTPADVLRMLVLPALHEVGTAWEQGMLDVADEHLATAVARRIVARLGPNFAVRGRSLGSVVVGCAPGDRHEVGIAVLANLLRGHNIDPIELGGDVPPTAFRRAVDVADRPLAVCIGVTIVDAIDGVAAVQRELADIDIPILVGGAAAATAALEGVTMVSTMDEAIAEIRRRVR